MSLWIIVPLACLLSLAGCWLITRSAKLRRLSNVEPVENRWHEQATPGLGGIPIYVAFLLCAVFAQTLSHFALAILVSAFVLLLLGVYDDIKATTPIVKLGVQIMSATLFLFVFAADYSFIYGHIPILHLCFCLIWIIGIINAINLLDNMDGLSGGVALIACLSIALLLSQKLYLGDPSTLYFILAAALTGFLFLNINPAKLFMGDAGALWIGLAVGVGTVLLTTGVKRVITSNSVLTYWGLWIAPMLICAVPICDTLMVMITRNHRGQSVWVGGQDHLSHRLVALGLSQRTSVAILWFVAILSSALALLTQFYSEADWSIPVTVYGCILVLGLFWLTWVTAAPNGVAIRRRMRNVGS